MNEIRFGPDPTPQAAQEMRALQQGRALARIVRETMDRMRTPLWFWEAEQYAAPAGAGEFQIFGRGSFRDQ